MKRKAWMTLIATAFVSTFALAQMGPGSGPGPYGGGYGGHGMGPGMMGHMGMGMGPGAFTQGGCGLSAGVAEKLGLTQEQRTRIAGIFEESWNERARVHEQMYELDRTTRERVDEVLTPEQRARLGEGRWGFGYGWR